MIQVGQLAQQDPLLSYATVMASEILKHATLQPAARRRTWIRREMNRTNPGIGDAVLRKFDELIRNGRNSNQALFDALRLTIANNIASGLERKVAQRQPASGLGESPNDISAVMCGITGIIGAGGSIYGAAAGNPAGSVAIGETAANAMLSNGCNAAALREGTRTAEANARIAEANAAAAAHGGVTVSGDNTVLYVVGGGVALVTILGAVLLLRKK